ncbi:MAG TPA: MarR family transcriptional regulator [Firmicutes bacterium]|nr:MarR family transcriptional regulator [Bacillota bacterium]
MDLKTVNLTLKLLARALDELIYKPKAKEEEGCLSCVQEACLRYIYYHSSPKQPKPSGKEVADALMISNAAVTKLLDRLEKKAYISREYNPTDRRQVSIILTAAGREAIHATEREQEEKLGEILDRLSAEDKDRFFQGLNSFMEAALVDREVIGRICLRCGWAHRPDCPGNQLYQQLTGEEKEKV